MPSPTPVDLLRDATPAPLTDRFAARLVDTVLASAISQQLAHLALGGRRFDPGWSVQLFLLVTALVALTAVVHLVFTALCEAAWGRTLGKQLLRLRTVGPDTVSHPTPSQAVRRNVFVTFGVLGLVPFVGNVLALTAQVVAAVTLALGIHRDTALRQGWHDRFAGGTRVVKLPRP